ncbi:MAG: alpha-amylase family glycosyl hydrolase, partial [Planctomycetota bacterium]
PGDHYAFAVDPSQPLLDPSAVAVDRTHRLPAIVTAPPEPVAWQRPGHARTDSIIYEMHVRGERVDHLVQLGVTAVELLPVHEFDETENGGNYWGYSPLAWFAPNRRYAAGDPIEEFRAMVRTLHAAGIEVLLDVVFNHTGEQGADGPVWHFKALEGRHAYDEIDRTGCGNTINCRDPWMQRMILDGLRWWHVGLGVDGFRFDLATVLSPELVHAIEEDPALAAAHLIAEPWDAGGGHQVEGWPGNERWSVWNDRYRDEVRRCWIEDDHGGGGLATRLSGSSDMFDEGPARGINFVTAHDGFTLHDLVSYDRKTNEDGREGEPSANLGALRERSRRNLLATLLLSQGVPMLVAGDEWGRSQDGDNNPYDSDRYWLEWDNRDESLLEFTGHLIRLRKRIPALRRDRFLDDHEVDWFGPDGQAPDWDDQPGRFAYHLDDLIVAVNLDRAPCGFDLPEGPWTLVVDTAGEDLDAELPTAHVLLAERSMVVLRRRHVE